MHGCSGLYRSKDILVQHTCQHTSAYSYDLIFEKTLSKAKAILQRQDTNEIAATFGTSPRPHVACRAKGTSTRLRPEYVVQRPKNLEKKHVLNLKGIFVNGTMKPAGSRAVVAPTMAGMMEEVTDCGSSCRIHIFRRVPRAAATCLIPARVELPSLHPPPHGLPHAAAAARPGPATSRTPRSLLPSQDI